MLPCKCKTQADVTGGATGSLLRVQPESPRPNTDRYSLSSLTPGPLSVSRLYSVTVNKHTLQLPA
eukprot:289129-Rhodomonas_salina.2